jgi:hypothetical protein
MIKEGLMVFSPFVLAATTGLPAVSPSGSMIHGVIQFGALGLCGYMVYCNIRYQNTLMNQYHKERENLVATIEKATKMYETLLERVLNSLNRVSDALDDRPCLRKDSRLKQE